MEAVPDSKCQEGTRGGAYAERLESLSGARFGSLLCAHVVEHMRFEDAVEFVGAHGRTVRPCGPVALLVPQEAGYRSDPTHVEYMDFVRLHRFLEAHGIEPERSYSFPFPRIVGRVFPHNEFVVVGRRSPGALPHPA